jgi:hypothetical protein
MGRFETSDEHRSEAHRPVRVPILVSDVYRAAREMVEDLEGWKLVRADDEGHVLHCEARGGFLAGTAKVTIQVEGPSDLPSSTVHVRSETDGGLLARDKAIVASFVRPFHRRVC